MIVVTTNEVEGRRVVRVLGTVEGSIVRARHVGSDLMAGLRNIVGGEVHGYSRLMTEARAQALDRMRESARQMGTNAVIGARFATSMIMGGAAEILVYGTAVVIEESEDDA